jgi:hypothetical protein
MTTATTISINPDAIHEDEDGLVWAQINGELFELFFKCIDQTPAEMLENHVLTSYRHNGERTYVDKIFLDDINKALGC